MIVFHHTMPDMEMQTLAERMALSLHLGKHSDMTIICRGRTFHVHQVIVCSASKFFERACDGKFKEAHNATIDCSADEPKALERMLSHMYTDDYDENDQLVIEPRRESGTQDAHDVRINISRSYIREWAMHDDRQNALDATRKPSFSTTYSDIGSDDAMEYWKVKVSTVWNNVQVYAIAEKYDVQPLKALAAKRFQISISGQWETEDILMILAEVYSSTPSTDPGLREEIIRVCERYSDELLVLPEFHEMLRNDGGLAIDIARMFYKSKQLLDTEVNNLKETVHDLSAQNLETKRKVQSYQDKLAHNKLWAAEEKRVLDDILLQHARCPECSTALHLHMTKGNSKKQIAVRFTCASCNAPFPLPQS